MTRKIKKAGVIGSGVMGATIAAQLANVGIETILLDIVSSELTDEDKKKGLTLDSRDFRNKMATKGVQTALTSKPASFYVPENAKRIQVGNLEDDLNILKTVDWIIEVVVERLDIKKIVFEKIESVLTPGTFVSSNTSGISARDLCEGRTEAFRKHFAITHFFNPPRYMKLVELVPGPDTLPEVMDILAEIHERRLGKGIVYAKDTPNFVANRIGVFSAFSAVRTMQDMGLTVEEMDQYTGPIIGFPKSATLRTMDIVGLDTLLHVAENVYNGVLEDEQREMFKPPLLLTQMLEKGLLGEKTGQGFYKKAKDETNKKVILSIDPNTLEYVKQKKVSSASMEAAKNSPGISKKISTLYYGNDKAGNFIFRTLSEQLIYAANRVPEIADDIVSVDNAMKWGYGRKLGPFETWDAVGLIKSVEKMKTAGFPIPDWIQEMVDGEKTFFYKKEAGTSLYYDPASKDYKEIQVHPGIILLPSLKEREKLLAANNGASLIDMGDGVACLEFHSKMNTIGDDVVNMINNATRIVKENFEGLVIANHSDHFSVGANLALVLFTAQEEEWDDLDFMVRGLQTALMGLKYLDKPVVAAPVGMALGGGCEICLAADRVRFGAETYMGLVEAGVGVIPAGGGTKELLLRNTEHLFRVGRGGVYPKQIELMPFIARAFETISMAKVSTSGPDAVKLGYLRNTDKMTVNKDFLIQDAKNMVLAMNLEGYIPPTPKTEIRVAGETSLAVFKHALWTMEKSGFITAHDVTVSTHVANILCGGKVFSDTLVTEQYLLDLEREAFVSLCGEPKTLARMQHMLTTGKPLRN